MDYPLENLDPERFQQLCQSLLVQEFRDVRCFPVAQPDGGRDAVSFLSERGGDKFLVFQVKYVRKLHAETDLHKWLLAIVEDEAPKVRELIPRGAVQYVLITNISGTAHLDKGSIDKLNRLLKDELGIPSSCWWRDDISRRLDNAWNLKWMYPEILSGPDLLRIIIESGLSEHRERRLAAVRAFLRFQYDTDEEVRFKQVELQNKLLDLFVDIPIAPREQVDRRQHYLYQTIVAGAVSDLTTDVDISELEVQYNLSDGRWTGNELTVGCATLLLSRQMQQQMPRVVIEGAPGQGKSTIAQYICQVHRMRLLEEENALRSVVEHHASAPVRLPIKVDLPDLAQWLSKKDPFNLDQSDAVPVNWSKSIESFLAALISRQSGGMHFTVDDLIAVFRVSAVLLVLDGLDEVADMTSRHEVVTEIVRGVQRLEENAASLQTIVTSRPAAFANSPGMPSVKYPHFQLLSLTRALILDYAERWLRARRMDSKQSAEFRSVLKEKLDQPHLRDLARNPMQLAILLSLMLTRGASLPDKRTALYDYYIDRFFSREAEKSSIVLSHRELLIDIHRYLAWLLHSEAEKNNARPSVRQERLQQMVEEYLAREGHNPALAKELFTGMVERVVALVSRVQGTFEFEVQPLREYFAACHLYYTAPQSSPGKETTGSKPDRFDAIARNFYWLNVTRFYAGCYSKGELPSLVERLQELASAPGFHLISHPRMLAATLLGDWVFTQNPKSVQQVVDLILSRASLRYVLAPFEDRRFRPGAQNALVLPTKCGREELIRRCFQILRESPPRDLALQLLRLLKANSESYPDVSRLWFETAESVAPDDRFTWLKNGLLLGALSTVQLESLQALLSSADLRMDARVLALLFQARRIDYLHSSEEVFEAVVSLILDLGVSAQPQRRIESPLDALSHAIDPGRYARAFRDRQPGPLAGYLERHNSSARLTWSPQLATATESFDSHRSCVEIARVAETECQRSAIEWATDINPWNTVIEAGREVWGDRLALLSLATVAAGIRSTAEKCAESPELLDTTRPLARRVRYARLRSGAHKWWRAQLEIAKSDTEFLLVLLPLLTWTTLPALLANADLLDTLLGKLSSRQWHRLFQAATKCVSMARPNEERSENLDCSKLPSEMSLRLAAIVSIRLQPPNSRTVYERYIKDRETKDLAILSCVQQEALDAKNFGTGSWAPDLQLVQHCYGLGVAFEPTSFRKHGSRREPGIMSLNIAEEILRTPDRFPGFLVTAAEERCRIDVSSKATPVADIAEKENWFLTT